MSKITSQSRQGANALRLAAAALTLCMGMPCWSAPPWEPRAKTAGFGNLQTRAVLTCRQVQDDDDPALNSVRMVNRSGPRFPEGHIFKVRLRWTDTWAKGIEERRSLPLPVALPPTHSIVLPIVGAAHFQCWATPGAFEREP